MPADEVQAGHYLTPSLQRRMCEELHERKFEAVYLRLAGDDSRRLQFVENTSEMARPWLYTTPTFPALRLRDRECVYGLRRHLLLPSVTSLHPFFPASDSVVRLPEDDQVCSGCLGYNRRPTKWTPRHHLQCPARDKTRRHDSIKAALLEFVKIPDLVEAMTEVADVDIHMVPRRHDLVYLFREDGKKFLADVTVRAVKEQDIIRWPTEQEIDQRKEANKKDRHETVHFRWEDHSAETASEAVLRGRALRQLVGERVTGPTLEAARKVKHRDFETRFANTRDDAVFTALPFTAGGGVGHELGDLTRRVYHVLGDDTREKVRKRKNLRSRCSVALVRHGCCLSFYCMPVTPSVPIRQPGR